MISNEWTVPPTTLDGATCLHSTPQDERDVLGSHDGRDVTENALATFGMGLSACNVTQAMIVTPPEGKSYPAVL